MRENSNVIALDLANNSLTDLIGGAVGKMLAANKALRALNLGFNNLTSQFLEPLGRGLQSNKVLTSLVLESNPVFLLSKDHGGPSGHATSDHGSNSATSSHSAFAAVEPFIVSIAGSSSLTILNLFNTNLSFDVGRALYKAVLKNSSVVSLELGGNSVSQSDLETISIHLRNNQERAMQAESKETDALVSIQVRAEAIRNEQDKVAKDKADAEWHEENARKRAEVREKEQWECARQKAEEDVQHLVRMEAENKKYVEQREAEKKAKAKAKK